MPNQKQRAWHEQRQTALTSTDSPKILGLSRWGSPRSVYLDKVTPVPDSQPESSLSAWLGLELEETIAKRFTQETGYETRRSTLFRRLPGYPHLAAHIDFQVLNRKTILECKTRGDRKGWGPDGSEVVPADVWVQAQHQMLVWGAKHLTVGALFALRDFGLFHLTADTLFQKELLRRDDRFWMDHVVARVPPDVIWFDDDLLSQQYPVDDGTMRTATPATDALIKDYRETQAEQADVEKRLATIKARLKEVIGQHAGVQGTNGTVSWRTDKPNPQVDHELLGQELMLAAARAGVSPEELKDLVNHATTKRDPRRVFLLKD